MIDETFEEFENGILSEILHSNLNNNDAINIVN